MKRINDKSDMSELETMVYNDMKDWAIARRLWNNDIVHIDKIIDGYAEHMGWKQEGSSSFEIIGQ